MGFHDRFVNWIIQCITTPTYTFNLNGEIVGSDRPTMGIRQGGPLLQYLFLIFAEDFSTLLNIAEAQNDIQELQLNRNGPTINHLFFAGHSFIFCSARARNPRNIVCILRKYEQSSRQIINLLYISVEM